MSPWILISKSGFALAAVSFSNLDWIVLFGYFVGVLLLGFWFWRKNQSSEQFTSGGRSLSGWLCGLSIFATYLSSISYLALPGKAFVDNWNPFVFSLALPLAAFVAARFFVPLYRKLSMSGEVSAYSILEERFGLWARVYASCFYLLFQIARIGVVMYLMALPMAVIFGWDIRILIVVTGAIVIAYSFVGGIVAVIWADAVQAIVLMCGALLALGILLMDMPEGASQVFEIAKRDEKFSLGSWNVLDLSSSTVWVILAYGVFENLRNFGVDQSYIQRYIASKDDREATKSVWLAAILYVPVSALFFFIGTSLYAYYESHPADLDEVRRIVAEQKAIYVDSNSVGDLSYEEKVQSQLQQLESKDLGDRVFPHFIASHLPFGVRGLLIAAIFAAAMSTVSTSLNSSATLVMSDFYKRLMNSEATDRQEIWVLRIATIVWGILGTLVALALVQVSESALDIWWLMTSVLGAGILGLFLLGLVVPEVSSRQAVYILSAGLLLIAWMTVSGNKEIWPEGLGFMASPLNRLLVIVIGPIAMVVIGKLVKNRA